MKVLIVYYSKTENTEKLASILAEAMGADSERLIDKKNRNGFWGYIMSGRDSVKKMLTTLEPTIKDPADYDLVIFGTPIWARGISPAIRTYLEQNKEKIKNYAFFCTSGKTAPEKLVKPFFEIMERNPIAYTSLNNMEFGVPEVYRERVQNFMNTVVEHLQMQSINNSAQE